MNRRSVNIVLLLLLFFMGMGGAYLIRPMFSSDQSSRLNRNEGQFLSVVAILSSQCAFCNDPRVIEGLKETIESIRFTALENGVESSVTLLSVDASIQQGLEYLDQFENVDEIIVGNNWRNTGAFEYIWNNETVKAATPQVLIFYEDIHVTAASGQIALLSKRDELIRHATNATEIVELPHYILSDEFSGLLKTRIVEIKTEL